MPDKTLKIMFTADAVYQTAEPVTYHAGQIETMREDLALRWVKRGVATDDAGLIAAAEAAKNPPPAPMPTPAAPTTNAPVRPTLAPARKPRDADEV